MTDDKHDARRTVLLVLALGALLLGPLGPGAVSGAQPESEVARAFVSTGICGQTVEVSLGVDWGEDRDKPAVMIEESYPADWNVAVARQGGSTDTPGKVKWFLDDPSVTEVTYRLIVPDGATGMFAFHGEFRDESMRDNPNAEVSGESLLEVACGAVVERGGLTPAKTCGETFTVTLELHWAQSEHLIIEESFPEGWNAGAASHGGSMDTSGQVKWFLQDPEIGQLSYELSVPAQAQGVFMFSGVFRDDALESGDPSRMILGEHQVEVDCADGFSPQPPGPDEGAMAQRSAPDTAHPQSRQDQSFRVAITLVWGDAGLVQLREVLPSPAMTVSEISDGGQRVDDAIEWALGDPATTSVEYRLTVPDTASLQVFRQWAFAGTVMDDLKADPVMIAGDQSFAVIHRFDGMQDCVFSDDDLFAVIDAWKSTGATDNELFSGIDGWKLLPGPYC